MKFKDWHQKEYDLPLDKTLVWRPSAYALVIYEGKILMIKSNPHGMWELPGGGVNAEETLAEGVIREVFEETGYEIVAKEEPIFFGEQFFYSPDTDRYFHTLSFLLIGELTQKPQEPHHDIREIAEVRWVDTTEIGHYIINPLFVPVFRHMLQKILGSKKKE